MAISDAQRIIDEGNTFTYTATLLNAAGTAIPLSSISTITLTQFVAGTGTIVNNRDGQNVLNTANVTIHATSGLLTWLGQPDDSAIVGTGRAPGILEQHYALFKVTYVVGSDTKYLNHPVELNIRQLQKIP